MRLKYERNDLSYCKNRANRSYVRQYFITYMLQYTVMALCVSSETVLNLMVPMSKNNVYLFKNIESMLIIKRK